MVFWGQGITDAQINSEQLCLNTRLAPAQASQDAIMNEETSLKAPALDEEQLAMAGCERRRLIYLWAVA